MKDRFLEISGIRKEIHTLFLRLEEKRKDMKENYFAFVSSNHNHFFAIDSLRFQLKLTENELTFLNEQFIMIDNRLYCDYYKLYNHVYDYYVANISTELVKSVFPIYKDLDPTKVYEHEMVHKVYKDVSFMIHKAYQYMELEYRKRDNEKRLISTGIHIGNYVHTRVFTDTIIKTNIQMFEQYLNTYFIYHMTFLVNLKDRLGMLLHHVMRKPPPEEGCNVDEIEDNFIRVMKDTNEHMLDVSNPEQNVSVYTQTDDLTPEVDPETKTDDIDEPVAETAIEQVVDPVVQPVAETAIEQVVEVATEPVVQPVAEVATEPVVQPVAETVIEQVVEDDYVPVIEPVAQPESEPVVQPVAEVANDPLVVSVADIATESVVQPVAETVIEQVVEDDYVPLIEQVAQPESEPVVKSVAEIATDPLVVSVAEIATDPLVVSVAEIATDPLVVSVAEIATETVVASVPNVEVFNPIIDHILENKIAEPKKKKRARKIKQGI
jgi:hypothetical protein